MLASGSRSDIGDWQLHLNQRITWSCIILDFIHLTFTICLILLRKTFHHKKGDDACKVFDEMPNRDTVAWNVMISCCIRNNRTRDALSLFDVMQSESCRCPPNDVTCLLLLQACAHLNALEFGERIHGYIVESGYGCSQFI